MSEVQYGELGDTFYFNFASNGLSGSASDGTSPICHVRLRGAASSAAPVHSPTPFLLSSASYRDGWWEVAIAATVLNGFAAGSQYAVFVGATISSETPGAYVGSIQLAKALTGADLGLMLDTTIASVTTQTVLVLTDGSDIDNQYTDLLGWVQSAANPKRFARFYSSSYVGATKTLTLPQAITGFNALSGDSIRISTAFHPIAFTRLLPDALDNGYIKSSVKRVRNSDIQGDGTAISPWGP